MNTQIRCLHSENQNNPVLALALEESEAIYWSKYYQEESPFIIYSTRIAGAFVGALPELDILALNRVIGLGMTDTVNSSHINEILRFFEKAGSKRFFIQLSPYVKQKNLKELLADHGLRHYNNWIKLIGHSDVTLPEVHSVLKISKVDKSDSKTYGQIIHKSFEWEDKRLIDFLASTVGKPGYKHYFALFNDKPIAAAALHTTVPYASMAFAGTLPGYRGMGGQSILLQARIKDAIKLGCKYIISETAEHTEDKPVASYRNLLRFGFERAYLRENWLFEC